MSLDTAEVKPAIRPRFISHGTLGSKDLAQTRRFYEEFLGLEVVQTSPISLMIRLGGDHVYAVVQVKDKPEMPRIYHNGLDVETPQEVDEAYRTVLANQETWGLHKAPGRSPSTAPTASCSGTSTTIAGRSCPTRRAATGGSSSRATRRAKAIWSTSSTSAGPTGRGRVSAGK